MLFFVSNKGLKKTEIDFWSMVRLSWMTVYFGMCTNFARMTMDYYLELQKL